MINFRKIASVLASTVMVGSTVAMAAAANFPAPFVQNGVADVAVVWGTAAASTDLVAVNDVTVKLQENLAAQTAAGTTTEGATMGGGDYVKIEKDVNKFNLGNTMDQIYSSLTDEELSTVLKSGTYENDANSAFDFEQKMNLGSIELKHFQDDDFNKGDPIIGFDINKPDHILNYTLEFTPDSAENGQVFGLTTGDDLLETTDLPMLGRTYFIQKVESTSNGVKLTLLDNANSAIVTQGETKTITVGSTSYDVSIVFISTSEVKLNVNGVTTNSMEEGGVFKVATDTYVAVKDIMAREKTGTTDSVEISLGSGKIVLENGQEVEMNEKQLSDIENADGSDKYASTLKAYVTNSSNTISKIVMSWDATDDIWVASGTDLLLPGFETIKLSIGGFNTPKKEVTTIENDGTSKFRLKTTDSKGDLDFDLMALNSSKTGIAGLGEDPNNRLVTSTSDDLDLNLSRNDMFVASYVSGNVGESYMIQITDIDDSDATKNVTDFKALGDDSKFSLDIGETKDLGNVRLKLIVANPTLNIAHVNITDTSNSPAATSFDRIITDEGLRLQLPVIDPTATVAIKTGGINLTSPTNPPSWYMNVTEEDKDGNILKGGSFTVKLGITNDQKATVESIDDAASFSGGDLLSSEDNSDLRIGYLNSDLATKVTFDTAPDQDTAEIEYHGSQSNGDVFISESGAAVVAAAGGTTATGVQSLGSVSVKDSEVSSVSSKNLIVVGGSCVNTVAAKLLGSDTPICGDAFTTATTVASGQYLIQTFASPYASNKVATLVAGYNAGDTTNAAKYLTTQTVDTTVGKKYIGTTATSASLSVSAGTTNVTA